MAEEKKPRPEFKKPLAKPEVKASDDPNYRYIVRIVSTDIKGEKKVNMGLHKIKGISFMFSNFVCYNAKVDPFKKIGNLTDEEVLRLEDVIRNPAKYNAPAWILNRRNDYETGHDMHLITTDLTLMLDNDLKRMKKVKSYKGLRHMWGLPVRGQRTKSNFRKNKGKVSLANKKPAPKKG
ncbi:MAG: 30S ribosomal protein S13 [Candidatus Woesearchaeota archaeon]